VKITILGSGTSQGVPVIACSCDVCKSSDSKDNRTRSSIMIELEGENYVIDTGPDFRQQMLREKVQSLRAILFTHEHKDHIAGLDDVRAFNFKEEREMEIYCSERVEVALRREFHYCFSDVRYPGIPKLNLNQISNNPFELPNGFRVIPIEVMHYKLPVQAFRFGDFSYVTDAKTISDTEKEKLHELNILVLKKFEMLDYDVYIDNHVSNLEDHTYKALNALSYAIVDEYMLKDIQEEGEQDVEQYGTRL
jgi:phosphoribosyl 1,2-cyclic phosphate phosphodiesterase